MYLFFVYLTLVHVTSTLTSEERFQSWKSFSYLAKNGPKECTDTNVHSCLEEATLTNLDKEFHYFRRVGRRAFLAIVVPENDSGKVISRTMVKLAAKHNSIYGMTRANVTMRSSLWAFYNDSAIPESSQVAALYASFSGRNLQVVDLGMLWAGLFRNGNLRSLVAPVRFRPINRLSPREFSEGVAVDGNLDLAPYTQRWATKAGDIFVVTRADLPHGFIDIVKIAVGTMLEVEAPISTIVSNLKQYYGDEEGKVFAAMWVA